MLANRGSVGEVRILRPETADSMMHDHLAGTPRAAFLGQAGYGLGVGVITEEAAAEAGLPPGTVFWGSASGSFFWLDRERGLIGLYLGQTIRQPDLAREFRAAVYAALDSPGGPRLPPAGRPR
jgi:CubicO group peptidase (beta-lactamase class C family)